MAQQYTNDFIKLKLSELIGMYSQSYYGVKCNQNHTICNKTLELMKIIIDEKKKLTGDKLKVRVSFCE